MKYAALIYSTPGSFDALSENKYKGVVAEYMALADDPRAVASGGGAVEVRPLVER